MSRIQITVDGKTVMDAVVNIRRGDLPPIKDIQGDLQKAAGGTFQPWAPLTMQSLAIVLQPMMVGQDVPDTTIAVTTRSNGWTLDVQQ